MLVSDVQRIYKFGKDAQGVNVTEGSAKDNYILGGKGANLAEMAKIGLPVPPGFTITCQTCMEYANAGNVWPEGVLDLIEQARLDLEERAGKKLGDPKDPLLVSVRSGAPFSMPGMMDTVLNLGMNDLSVQGLIDQTQNPRFAWDSYRRFIQMFSDVVMGVDADNFENAITARKIAAGVRNDCDLTTEDLKALVDEFKGIFTSNVSAEDHPELVGASGTVEFPQDPSVQLLLAIQAVFGSWNNSRAILYRKQNKISDDLGTAVNVMSMVFGNKGETSATGVAFTRNPADGTKEFYGDYLVNAQGEDVVAGIRNTEPIETLKHTPGLEKAGQELEDVFVILEIGCNIVCAECLFVFTVVQVLVADRYVAVPYLVVKRLVVFKVDRYVVGIYRLVVFSFFEIPVSHAAVAFPYEFLAVLIVAQGFVFFDSLFILAFCLKLLCILILHRRCGHIIIDGGPAAAYKYHTCDYSDDYLGPEA